MDKIRRWRIYTEDFDAGKIYLLTADNFKGATITAGVGIWKGQRERSLVIELLDFENDPKFSRKVMALADALRYQGKQESVLVTQELIRGVNVKC